MPLVLSLLITGLVLLAVGVTLLVALSTSLFTGPVPTGPDSMSLAGPILAGAVAWAATILAGWLCVARGGFDWVSDRPLIPLLAVTGGIVGVGLAWFLGFLIWSERMSPGPLASLAASLFSPLLLQALLLACAWSAPEHLHGAWWTKGAGLALAPAALCGAAFAGWGIRDFARQSAARTAREVSERAAINAEFARRAALTELQRVREDLEALPPATPFWSLGCMLLDVHDEEARRLILARGRQIPDFDAELKGVAECDSTVLRAGAVEFIRRSESRDPAWAELVGAAMVRLTEDVQTAPDLISKRDADLAAEVERMAAAAACFPASNYATPLASLRAAIEAASVSDRRARALHILQTLTAGDQACSASPP